jgi:membrane fusion protein (multidrug efflux system)
MRWVIGVVLVALLAAGAAWRYWGTDAFTSSKAAPAASAPAAPVTVAAGPVTLGAVRREIEAVGTLRSNESVILRFEVAGRISEIMFEEGKPVKKGMPLVRLDATIARALAEQARINFELSKTNHDRAQALFSRGAGTDRARDEAVAKLQSDEAALGLARATLDKATLLAPFDGIIGLRRVSVGDYVNPGQDLVNLENIEQLKVDFRVPEIHSIRLRVGQKLQIRLEALPGSSYEGEVYAIDPAYDPNGRAVVLRGRLANRDGLLRSGMFARVTLLVDEQQDVIMVPETALMPVGQDHFVYRVVNDKAVMTKVKVGQRRQGRVEVMEGLAKDATIVIEGAVKLRDGAAVRTVPVPAA